MLVRTASVGLYSSAGTCFKAAAWTTYCTSWRKARVSRSRSRTSPRKPRRRLSPSAWLSSCCLNSSREKQMTRRGASSRERRWRMKAWPKAPVPRVTRMDVPASTDPPNGGKPCDLALYYGVAVDSASLLDFSLVPVTDDDRDLLYRLALDPVARLWGFYPTAPTRKQHEAWFAAWMARPDCARWIVRLGEQRAGLISAQRANQPAAHRSLNPPPSVR